MPESASVPEGWRFDEPSRASPPVPVFTGRLLGGRLLGRSVGAGALAVTVSAPEALGTVVVEFVGTGITGATAAPGDWISSAAGQGSLRVLAVVADAGIIQFSLQVADVSAPAPQAVVIAGSGAADRPLLGVGGVEVSISR